MQAVAERVSTVALADYVTVRQAATAIGLSEKAIRRKIEKGEWIEGREFRRSPDGGVYVSVRGFCKWVESGQA